MRGGCKYPGRLHQTVPPLTRCEETLRRRGSTTGLSAQCARLGAGFPPRGWSLQERRPHPVPSEGGAGLRPGPKPAASLNLVLLTSAEQRLLILIGPGVVRLGLGPGVPCPKPSHCAACKLAISDLAMSREHRIAQGPALEPKDSLNLSSEKQPWTSTSQPWWL
ncbi:uncharacterized protein LOC144582935 [Callithrix jacchus]